ncbi:MAG TPA: hypothetical protein VGP06_08035, partial [Janthinobacterium sp.]|nr:hypothetical protein [Janthinobacterium sp.]
MKINECPKLMKWRIEVKNIITYQFNQYSIAYVAAPAYDVLNDLSDALTSIKNRQSSGILSSLMRRAGTPA